MTIKRLAGGLILLLFCELCEAQASLVTPLVLHELADARWRVRRNAFEVVAANPRVTAEASLERLLIQLRIRENIECEKATPDLFEDEDYVAYDEELTNLVEQIAIYGNSPRTWKALVWMRYNPDSQTGKWLAEHSQTLPYIRGLVKSPNPVRRMNAAYLLALILQNSKEDLYFRQGKYRSLKTIIRSLALGDEPLVQQFATKGLGLIGDSDDIPFLKSLSLSAQDPYTGKFAADAARRISESNGK
jgi:hypothetical protein